MDKSKPDKMGYVRAKVLNGYEGEAWPTGMIGWAEVGTDKVYDNNFIDYWHHRWEATKPRVEFETKEECVEWLEDCTSYDASDLQDNVNNPAHYGKGEIEAIDYISDFLTPEEYQGYLRGNIAKYLHRWPYKNGVEDLKKASWYLDRLINEAEKEGL
jgi:hypothetical protein